MRHYANIILTVIFTVCLTALLNAQIVISKPNLGFSQACASESFNTYNVTFAFSPEGDLTASNQFIIELSDDTGDFSVATVIYTSTAGSVTTSPATLTFSLPTTVSGEAYKLRIKSTSPAASSTPSDAFPAYYKAQDEPFTINNLVATGAYCPGGSYLLTIDNPGGPSNNSPLQYPSLTYNWYKETGPSTSAFVDSGESLVVNEPGTYFVETNYGSCTSNSYSNRVTVSESGSGSSSEIASSLGNPYCSGDGPTALSAISGQSYKWFKDDIEIDGATGQMYQTNESGTYTVEVDLGECIDTASITLNAEGFTSSIDVPETNYIDEGETLVVTVTTDAVSPTFQWYRNDSPITGAVNTSYEITQTGDYKVVVTQTSGCLASVEHIFVIIDAFPAVGNIPNVISPNGDGVNDTWVIPQQYVSGTNTKVAIYSSQGKMVLYTNDYQNNWPQTQLDFNDINPVYYYIITTANNSTKKGSITVLK
ncbi:gliding motility-associated C-terminal domain-containing protein [Aestuariivivens sp. NBU2969]|uniref:T9SS type B sorting domain-containing protein n=1 Tax=Aestuariivivens sp. NBU2969 TaxID=2873267 RepID=UPI001CBBB2DF|nr:gliding motility-associated C-terminal domain-containing protein [Aestuariivivens sp. NBU2969]